MTYFVWSQDRARSRSLMAHSTSSPFSQYHRGPPVTNNIIISFKSYRGTGCTYLIHVD